MTKTNYLSKFISLLMAFVLAICMVPRAFAAGEDTSGGGEPSAALTEQEGTIIIENAVANARYDLYKIFDVTYNESTKKYAYTINEGTSGSGRWLNFFFDLSKLNAGESDYITEIGSKYIHVYNPDKDQSTSTQAVYHLTYGDGDYVLDINDTNVADFATDALNYALSDAYFSAYKQVTPTVDGRYSVTGLDLGYYLVYPYGQSRYTNGGASVCALLTNAPYKTVTIKSTWPSITKQITSVTDTLGYTETGSGDGTVTVGDTVEFTITCKIPDPTGYSNYTLKISDTMSDGLDYLEESEEVYLLDNGGSKTDISTKGYFNFDEDSVDGISGVNGFTANIDVLTIKNENAALIGQKIQIVYRAKVTSGAISNGASNSATITYSNNPKDQTSTETSTPQVVKVYSNTLKVQKYDRDGATGNTLAGAEFYLYKLDKEDNSPIYYQRVKNETEDTINWVKDIKDATKYITGADGLVSFEGIDSGRYYLYESNPPSGFNALTKPIQVTITSSADDNGSLLIAEGKSTPTAPTVVVTDLPGKGSASEELQALTNTTYTYMVRVGNSGGALLPSTGGAGAFVIYGVSAAALVAAIVLLIRKNRKRKQAAQQ